MMLAPAAQIVIVIALAAIGVGFAAAWWRRGKALAALRAECNELRSRLDARERALAASIERGKALEIELAALHESLAHNDTRVEQLRDLVKVHVARRREFDEWANPIRASLGEGVSQVLHGLKDQLARQEFAMRRQERIVAEAQDQYRGKRDELERMRRELTLKNYHIAALNERFIRIEERMQDLSTQVAGMDAASAVDGLRSVGAQPEPATAAARPGVPEASPETERFTLEDGGSKDWMGILDDWHRQLHQRFDRLEQLQTRLRGGSAKSADTPQSRADRPGGTAAS